MPKLPVSWGNRRLGFDLRLENLLAWNQLFRSSPRRCDPLLPIFDYSLIFHLYLHSYLLFQLFLLFHSAQRPLQEVDDCRLVFCRVLPQMLHMCWPGKPGGTLWSRIREISFATLSRRIWRPPFSAFQVLHFRGTFEGGSSRSWSRGRAPRPPCADGNGPGQSGPPKHPVHLLLWIRGLARTSEW